MNKKEISEIKKLISRKDSQIVRFCGCYVDNEKNIRTTLKQPFLALEEDEMFKYINIFRRSLSGTLGKNLLNLEFPREQEEEGGTQNFLMKLRDSKLSDDNLLQEFYEKVIENYELLHNTCIFSL